MSEVQLAADGARLRLYREAPGWKGAAKVMAVGQFSCASAEAGAALLREAADQARASGADALIGPMDGDTWHSYRLVSESDGRKPFLLEPASKPQDLAAFAAAGFAPISAYFSASVPLDQIAGAVPEGSSGFAVEPWDGSDPKGLFTQVHALSVEAFAKNPFYKPITLEAFLAMYMPIVPMLKRELILFAHLPEGGLAGFLFGIPNYAEGPKPEAVILKTYASLRKGAGHAMSQRFYAAARGMGYRNAIHALIHEDNLSALRSGMNGAQVFRRYALMGRHLG